MGDHGKSKDKALEKAEWIKTWKMLSREAKNMEKDQKFWTTFKRSEDKELVSLHELYLVYESELHKERTKLFQTYKTINEMIVRFKKDLTTSQLSQEVVDKFKTVIEEINSRLGDFKKDIQIKQQQYSEEEKILRKEMELFDKKIDSWATESAYTAPKAINNESFLEKLEESNLLPEVVAFDKFLILNGGHNGGWDSVEHNLFLKIRNKNKGKPEFQIELLNVIATKSRDEIEVHENWYKTYLSLNEAKKKAILVWKDAKKAERNKVFSETEAELKLHQEIDKVIDEAQKKRLQAEKEERLKKLNEWKLEREIERTNQEQRRRLEEEKRAQLEEKKFMEQMKIKEKVIEYKTAKAQLNEFLEIENYMKEEAERDLKSQLAREEIAYFQQRDQCNTKEKMAKLRAKQSEKEEREKRLNSARRVEVPRDPTRLYQMTSSWKRRVDTPRTESARSLSVSSVPRLAVPTWRQVNV